MNEDTIQRKIKQLEDELRNLKGIQGAIQNIPAYTYELLNPNDLKYKITYADGKNSIITRMYTVGTKYIGHILTKPLNNTQFILFNFMDSDIQEILLMSTREILSVEPVA